MVQALALAAAASGSDMQIVGVDPARRERDPKQPTDAEAHAQRARLQAYDERAPSLSADDVHRIASAEAKRARKAAKRKGQ